MLTIYLYSAIIEVSFLKGRDTMTKSKAQLEATKRYESKTYDSIRLLLPKGTKDRIKATGYSVNGFISKAVLNALDLQPLPRDQIGNTDPDATTTTTTTE